MKSLRFIYRLSLFVATLWVFFVLALFIFFVTVFDKNKRIFFLSRITRVLTRVLTSLFGFQIHVKGKPCLKKNHLIACNHTSYLDIPFLQAVLHNNIFITTRDIKEKHFYLSFLPKILGACFIERRNTKNIRKEIKTIAKNLNKGFHVVFFPEGKSSAPHTLLPFHAPFFLSALHAKKTVLPVCIRYQHINGKALSPREQHFISWNRKKESFKTHFFRLMYEVKSLHTDIVFLPPLNHQTHTAKSLKDKTYRQIHLALQNKTP